MILENSFLQTFLHDTVCVFCLQRNVMIVLVSRIILRENNITTSSHKLSYLHSEQEELI